MSQVVFDPDAGEEFIAAVAYYEACQPGLGRRFRAAMETEIGHIREMPFRYRTLRSHFRRCLIPRFPFAIIFTIEPRFILIMAVAHTSRRPGYWLERAGG